MSIISDYCEDYAEGRMTFEELEGSMRQVIPRRYGWDDYLYNHKGWPEDNPWELEYTVLKLSIAQGLGHITIAEHGVLTKALTNPPIPDKPIVDLNADLATEQ